MNVGYSYWGFLADIKMNEKFEQLSTPDGNAFYSWSIIKELQKNNTVISIMPDRDIHAVQCHGKFAFNAWATTDRWLAYSQTLHLQYDNLSIDELYHIWDQCNFDYILHEWRMPIQGRNTLNCRDTADWQPDLWIQECLLKYCEDRNIKLFIFDLDYKIDIGIEFSDNVTILELGNKWQNSNVKSRKVYIPFDFSHINDFPIKSVNHRYNYLVYIGNRYERDWCIDKYFPDDLPFCVVHGNWTESGRDSEQRWPNIHFAKRLQTNEMYDAYSDAICTLLLAKKEYCDHQFMTARIIEAVFYGSLPLFIEEYGKDTIKEFTGKYANLLTVHGKEDVADRIKFFDSHAPLYHHIMLYLRERLKIMDATKFVEVLNDLL